MHKKKIQLAHLYYRNGSETSVNKTYKQVRKLAILKQTKKGNETAHLN